MKIGDKVQQIITPIRGEIIDTNSTKDGATGILFSAGDFSNGSKTVANGDTLSVTYSLSV